MRISSAKSTYRCISGGEERSSSTELEPKPRKAKRRGSTAGSPNKERFFDTQLIRRGRKLGFALHKREKLLGLRLRTMGKGR